MPDEAPSAEHDGDILARKATKYGERFVKDVFILRHIAGALYEAPAGGPFVNDRCNKSALTPSKDGEYVDLIRQNSEGQ